MKIEIKWAINFTIMSLVWMILEKLAGLHSTYIDYHLYLTNLFAIPAIWFIVLALKDKKKNFYSNKITYQQGLISGTILSLFIALISPLSQWVISNIISPEYFPNVIKRSLELGYYNSTTDAEANFNYKNYAIQGFFASIILGVLTSAIAMIFIKTKKKEI